ncbi:hypothetical protein [Sphingomonas sp. DBB INV C78]|uniref:hypothetical protein n=1 Tax=Sphingomonas sp. DBB INV C78 TaxID=3349434 RepID=UPI0036D3AB23
MSKTSRIVFMGLAIAAPAGMAQAQDISGSIDLSASAGYATNPFLEGDSPDDDSKTDTGFVEGSIRPNLAIIDDKGRSNFGAYYRRTEYFRRYSASDAYGVSASSDRRLSEKIDVRALLAFDSSIIGTAEADGELGGEIPQNPDIGLIGQRQRRNALDASVGMTIRPNARDAWMVDLDANKTVYPNDDIQTTDYVTYGARFGYSHALSENSSIGATLGYTKIDYDGFGRDAQIISPQITYSTRFRGGWSLDASLGISFTETKLLIGNSNTNAFSGTLALCKETSRTGLCIGGSQQTNASGFGDIRKETNIYGSYSYKLTERDTLSSRISYSRNSSQDRIISVKQEYLTGTIDYARQLDEKLRLTASVSYRDAYSRSLSPDADISGRVGVAYLLGDRR